MKPIIFIPGIEATKLVNSNTFDFDTVWNAYDNLGTAIGTKITGPYIEERLQLNPLYDLNPENIVERNYVAHMPYERPIRNLYKKINEGKKSPEPIFLFGYDWRLSNAENGKRLKLFTDSLKVKLKDYELEGFRFLTHSMGAMVFSCYLKLLPDFNDIDKVVLCAPPFLGSPYALIHMVKGDGGFKSFLNKLFGKNDDIRKVVRTYPSIYELSPSYDGALIDEISGANMSLLDGSNWQSNIYDDIPDLFAARIAQLNNFRWQDMLKLSDLPVDVRARMVIVAGSDDQTVTQLRVSPSEGKIRNFIRLDDMVRGSGDGTVPFISSTCYKDSIRTIAVKKESLFDELSNTLDFHGLFLTDSRVQNIVQRFFLSGSDAAKVSAGGDMAALKGKSSNMWYSIGSTVENISPF